MRVINPLLFTKLHYSLALLWLIFPTPLTPPSSSPPTFPSPSPLSQPPSPSPSYPPLPPPSQPCHPPSVPPPPLSHHCGEYSYCAPGQTCCCLYEFLGFCMINSCCDYKFGSCCYRTDYCCPREYPICHSHEPLCLKKSGNHYIGMPAIKKKFVRYKLPWRKPEESQDRTTEPLKWRKAALR